MKRGKPIPKKDRAWISVEKSPATLAKDVGLCIKCCARVCYRLGVYSDAVCPVCRGLGDKAVEYKALFRFNDLSDGRQKRNLTTGQSAHDRQGTKTDRTYSDDDIERIMIVCEGNMQKMEKMMPGMLARNIAYRISICPQLIERMEMIKEEKL